MMRIDTPQIWRSTFSGIKHGNSVQNYTRIKDTLEIHTKLGVPLYTVQYLISIKDNT